MSNELVPINGQLEATGDRRAALERLAVAAEGATSAEEAREIMLKGRTLATLLQQASAPLEEALLAGKASVLAARRLGVLLEGLSSRAPRVDGGFGKSNRHLVGGELGLGRGKVRELIRLARVDDPEFQRYIQSRDRIPSVHGALVACRIRPQVQADTRGRWDQKKRDAIGVRPPKNPSLDEGYSLIVRALGHLAGSCNGGSKKSTAVATAMQHLYEAEDLLKPYRGGYRA